MPEHTESIRVRYGETDQMGVVYHPNYFLDFEAGRTELLRRIFGLDPGPATPEGSWARGCESRRVPPGRAVSRSDGRSPA